MSQMPTCSKCGKPHWRFAACGDADKLLAQEIADARQAERLKVRAQYTAPPGYVQIGPNKFARITGREPTPVYVQIAPGKFRKAGNR